MTASLRHAAPASAGASTAPSCGSTSPASWVEACRRVLGRRSPDGLFAARRWYALDEVDGTGRMGSLAVATLLATGGAGPRRQLVAAASGTISTLVMSKSPLSPGALAAL